MYKCSVCLNTMPEYDLALLGHSYNKNEGVFLCNDCYVFFYSVRETGKYSIYKASLIKATNPYTWTKDGK